MTIPLGHYEDALSSALSDIDRLIGTKFAVSFTDAQNRDDDADGEPEDDDRDGREDDDTVEAA